jgi:hypothetical protein
MGAVFGWATYAGMKTVGTLRERYRSFADMEHGAEVLRGLGLALLIVGAFAGLFAAVGAWLERRDSVRAFVRSLARRGSPRRRRCCGRTLDDEDEHCRYCGTYRGHRVLLRVKTVSLYGLGLVLVLGVSGSLAYLFLKLALLIDGAVPSGYGTWVVVAMGFGLLIMSLTFVQR